MPIVVTDLALAPVKGMRLCEPDEVRLVESGPVGDRDFLVVDGENRLLLTQRTPALLRVRPEWGPGRDTDSDAWSLTLRFPDGDLVRAEPRLGEPVETAMYDGRRMPGRLVLGPFADALSDFLGQRVRLLRRDDRATGADDYPVTLMSLASLGVVAGELGMVELNPRRFRMTLTVSGVDAWEEHGWVGTDVAVGEAVLRVADPVPRCVVTTRDPRTGDRDAPVLHALSSLRGTKDVTFGIWCSVRRPGVVRRGDLVRPG